MKKRSSKSNKSSRTRKRVEDDLKLYEAKFRVLFDNVSSGVAIYEARDDGRDFVFTDFNRAAEEIEQVKKEDLAGRSVLEPDYPMPIIDEADRGRMGRAFSSALKGSRGNEVRFRLRRKDGQVIWAEMSWQPIYDDKHGYLGFRQSIRDISARKEIEEAMKKAEHEKETILDGLAERVVYRDRDMRILWANRAACESVGIAREELAGRRCYEALAQRDEPCEDCPVAKAIRTGRAHEVARQMSDGAVLVVRGLPVRDEQGSIIGGVEIALDVTEREHAAEALRPARDED